MGSINVEASGLDNQFMLPRGSRLARSRGYHRPRLLADATCRYTHANSFDPHADDNNLTLVETVYRSHLPSLYYWGMIAKDV